MVGWFRDLTLVERRTMLACLGGWSLDALDVQIFTFVIPSLLTVWGITTAQAGLLATVTLVVSSFGGWVAGAASDRFGRVRVLQVTILCLTFLCGFAQNFNKLFVLKGLQGLGFGGEWAAGARRGKKQRLGGCDDRRAAKGRRGAAAALGPALFGGAHTRRDRATAARATGA
jgi:MFS family permease